MEWICNNWFLVVAAIALLLVGARAVYMMYASPSSEQLDKVREWLLYACEPPIIHAAHSAGVLQNAPTGRRRHGKRQPNAPTHIQLLF